MEMENGNVKHKFKCDMNIKLSIKQKLRGLYAAFTSKLTMHYCIAMNIKQPPSQHSIVGKISTQYTFSFVSGTK